MKSIKNIFLYSSLLLLLLNVAACSTATTPEAQPEPFEVAEVTPAPQPMLTPAGPKALPVQYQNPTYQVDQQHFEEAFSEEETSTV